VDDSAGDNSLVVSDAFIGDPVFTATTTLPVFFTNVSQNDRPELPESMRHYQARLIGGSRRPGDPSRAFWRLRGGFGSR
jgi:hypothetical protein